MAIQLPETILSQLRDTVVVKYVAFLSVVIMIHDYFLTLPDEVRLIWPWEWRAGKVLYLATRYFAIVDEIGFLLFWFNSDFTADQCRMVFTTACWSLFVGIVIAQWIICMRTYALWGQSKLVLGVLLTLCLATETTSIVLMNGFINGLNWSISPFPTISRCYVITTANKLYVDFAMIMVVEFAVLVLTFWKGVSQWKMRKNSPLIAVLYRDGVVFFFCLFAISISNFLLAILSSPIYEFLLPEVQRILHSVLTSRIILHLREVSVCEIGTVNGVKSSLHFCVPARNGVESEADSEMSDFGITNRNADHGGDRGKDLEAK